MKTKFSFILVLIFTGFMQSSQLLACATCYGNPDHPMSKGLTAGVIILLSVIGFLLVGFASFFLFLRNRLKKFS